MIIVNWKVLHQIGMVRVCLIFMNVMIFIVLLLLSASKEQAGWMSVSMAGEGGGYMAGFGLGMMLTPCAVQRTSPFVKMIRKIGFLMTLVYCAILFPVFFAAVEPTPTRWAD